MARLNGAVWDPIPGAQTGKFTGGPAKGVAHKTQGGNYAGARSAYKSKKIVPHFTIDLDGTIYQHVDTDFSVSAVGNDSGGVQTNKDGARQIEIVGFVQKTCPRKQLVAFVALMEWLEKVHGIPLVWPMGRPPQRPEDAKESNTKVRNPALWDSVGGWYGHSQVPENHHWDPAWTDDEWNFIIQETQKPKPSPDPIPVGDDVVQFHYAIIGDKPEVWLVNVATAPRHVANFRDAETHVELSGHKLIDSPEPRVQIEDINGDKRWVMSMSDGRLYGL